MIFAILLTLFASPFVAAQAGPNTLAQYNPNERSMSMNGTWFIIPVNQTLLESAVPYPLIPLPLGDKSLFPTGFPTNTHPLLVAIGFRHDIRQGPLVIDNLMASQINVPYVDRLEDGETAFNYEIVSYIGGANGQDLMGLAPTLVADLLLGAPASWARFDPDTEAYKALTGSESGIQADEIIVPNPVSGPGVTPPAIDITFRSDPSPQYTTHTFHALINQPTIVANNMCQRDTYYFNESFAQPEMRTGTVVLYETTFVKKALAGHYDAVGGYSANGENVGFDAENCNTVYQNLDPVALE